MKYMQWTYSKNQKLRADHHPNFTPVYLLLHRLLTTYYHRIHQLPKNCNLLLFIFWSQEWYSVQIDYFLLFVCNLNFNGKYFLWTAAKNEIKFSYQYFELQAAKEEAKKKRKVNCGRHMWSRALDLFLIRMNQTMNSECSHKPPVLSDGY